MAKIDLRNEKQAAPPGMPKSLYVDVPGLKGTLPFDLGAIGKNRAELPQEVLDEEHAFVSAPIATPEKEKRRAVVPPAPVNLDDLPPAKQEEVLANVANAINNQSSTTFIPRGPGIAEAKAMADKAAAQAERKISETKPLPKAAPMPEPIAVTPSHTVDENTLPKCLHCGWPVNSMKPCEPTRLDKQLFVAAVLGQKRFSKEYSLLGGNMTVMFRSLTVDENDTIIKQMMQDWNDGKISGGPHSIMEATKYQMILSLASITTNVGAIALNELDDYEAESPENVKILPKVVDYVYKTAMPNEHTRRMISKAYGHFIETQSQLEAMAESPDFWQAIGV